MPTPSQCRGHTSRPPVVAVMLAACATLFSCPATADATRFGADAEYGHDSNVNRAALDKERQSDDSLSLEGHAARALVLSPRSGVVLRAALRATQYSDFHDLSNLDFSGRAAYRIQPVPGFTSPWFELSGQVDALRYRDSAIRDGYAGAVAASLGKYFTDRIRSEAGIGLERRGGGEGDVYDLSNRKIWLALDYRLTQKTILYGSVTRMNGEQVFTLFNTGPWAALYAYAKASAPDPVFAGAFGGAPMAYRIDARTDRYELGINIALQSNNALDLGWSHFESRADQGGGRYSGDALRIGYLHRFR